MVDWLVGGRGGIAGISVLSVPLRRFALRVLKAAARKDAAGSSTEVPDCRVNGGGGCGERDNVDIAGDECLEQAAWVGCGGGGRRWRER